MRRSTRWLSVVAAGGGGEPTFTPSFALTNTARSLDLTPDGFNWAQGAPIIIDKYGKYIVNMQTHLGGSIANGFLVSNNFGVTWADPTQTGFTGATGDQFIARGSMAYDGTNDLMHVLWLGAAATDGLIYRRYSITRDGSNNITGFTKVAGINLQLDYENAGTMEYQHPVIHYIQSSNTLICLWSARNGAGGAAKNEIRGSRRILSNTVADNTAANWLPLAAATSTTTIGQTPQVPYTAVLSDDSANGIAYPSSGLTPALDLYVLYSTGTSPHSWAYKKLTWGGVNYTVGSAVVICAINRAGGATGYNLKQQLGTSLRYDSAGRLWFGIATKNTGDTWTVGYITIATGVVSGLLDVYVAPTGDMSAADFVTGDVMWDSVSGRLFAAYTDLPAKAIYGAVVKPGATPTLVSTTLWSALRPWDIPTLYETRDQGKVLCVVRDFNDQADDNPPVYTPYYDGYFGRVTVA